MTGITLDVIIHVLANTIFHPLLTWLLPLTFRAQGFHWHMPPMRYSLAFSFFVVLFWWLRQLNDWIYNGRKYRNVNWSEEIVVITGGSSGLGGCIAAMMAGKGVKAVVVLDIRAPPEEMMEQWSDRITYYPCNVGDSSAVSRIATQIQSEIGHPTILINNAGQVAGGKSILELTPSEVQSVLSTNVLAHFYTTQAFLPALLDSPNGGHVVTVASALGYIGVKKTSAYTTSKAALLAFHESLTAELPSTIKTTLVCPGQFSTELFIGVETPSNFLAPILGPVDIAKLVVRDVEEGRGGWVYAPEYARWMCLMRCLPGGVGRVVRWASGVDRAMDAFENGVYVGHGAGGESKTD
ncbi:hypothetical protein YB2330_001647 [Saitoella coloradoensis]